MLVSNSLEFKLSYTSTTCLWILECMWTNTRVRVVLQDGLLGCLKDGCQEVAVVYALQKSEHIFRKLRLRFLNNPCEYLSPLGWWHGYKDISLHWPDKFIIIVYNSVVLFWNFIWTQIERYDVLRARNGTFEIQILESLQKEFKF